MKNVVTLSVTVTPEIKAFLDAKRQAGIRISYIITELVKELMKKESCQK